MALESEIASVTARVRKLLPLQSAKLSEEYFYQSLPLCVIDAVFSIGVKYDSTRQAVIRYCQHTSQGRIRHSNEMPQKSEQESISAFCSRPEQADASLMAERVYRNRQRTSSRGGILKAEAALQFAQTLRSFCVEHLQDVPNAMSNDALEAALRLIGRAAASPCSISGCSPALKIS
jgi:hypothetical protein